MRKHLLTKVLPAVLAALAGMALVARGETPPAKRFVITAHGAVGDGQTLNTRAIQTTIDRCTADGGGVVVIPEGTFLSGAIFLKQGVALRVEKNGVLKGTLDPVEYPQVPTRSGGIERVWTAALINATNMMPVELTGEGMIDGSGEMWERRDPRKPPLTPGQRDRAAAKIVHVATTNATANAAANAAAKPGWPRLIVIKDCRQVRVAGLTLKNQASWGLVFIYCEDVLAEGLTIRVTEYVPSSDGIDVDSCRRVRITHCDIQTHDDCISIKAGRDEDGLRVNRPSEDIVVENTRLGYGQGGVAFGSETSGGIRNVEVRDCVVGDGNWSAVRLKSSPARGGVVENVTCRNLELRGVERAFEMNLAWEKTPQNSSQGPPVFRNIKLINVTGTALAGGIIAGLKDSLIQNVRFENCRIAAQKGLVIRQARDIDVSGLTLKVEEGEAIMKRDVE